MAGRSFTSIVWSKAHSFFYIDMDFCRIAWIMVVSLAVFFSLSLSKSNWHRYQTDTSVVSLQKDYRSWKNTFPGFTACLINKADPTKTAKYIKKTWDIDKENNEYQYYSDFVSTIANLTFENLHTVAPYINDEKMQTINILELLVKVHPKFKVTVVSSNEIRNWTRVITEFGLCHSYNSIFSKYLSFKYCKKSTWRINNETEKEALFDNSSEPIKCHFLNRQCYTRVDSNPKWRIQYFIHSPFEVLEVGKLGSLPVYKGINSEENYESLETEYSETLKKLRPSQRKCRFLNEPINKQWLVYSRALCRISCRRRYAIEQCGCTPFFYNLPGIETCDMQGLLCLAKQSKELVRLRFDKFNCPCPQTCLDINYFIESFRYEKRDGYFANTASFRLRLIPPTIRLQRNILFSFEDLIVSFGGTAALFLGISFLSAIEVFFYIANIALLKFKSGYYDKKKNQNANI